MEHPDRRLFLKREAAGGKFGWRLLCVAVLAALVTIAPVRSSAFRRSSPPPEGGTTDRTSRADEPYRVTVCLHVADDLIFTRFFTESLQRQVRDQLAHYFGTMAEVEVVTAHPVLEKVATDGLDALSLSAADFKEQEFQGKVFLMAVDFRDGVYRLRWRQLDGDVQHVGPLYTRTTPDRQWLAKAACLAVKHDFAPVADVDPAPDGSQVALRFRGAARGDRLATWLDAGAVLQPYWVVRQQDGSVACLPIPHTVLQITGEGNSTRATVVTGLANPWKRTARVAGFRAIRLTTQAGRFRLRLLSTDDGSPVQTCTVYANSKGFEETGDADRLPGPDREGYVVATTDFDRLAYVTVRQSGAFKLLVPITQAWCEVELRLPADEHAQQRADWMRRLRYCVGDVEFLHFSLNQCFDDVNRMNDAKRYEDALSRARSAADSFQPLIVAAGGTVAGLASEAREIQMSSSPLLASARARADALRDRETQLREMADDLKDAVDKIDAQSRAAVLIKLANQAVQAGDVEKAIEKYAEALEVWPDQPETKRSLEKLREGWRIKSPEHEQARQFVYEPYAEAQADEIQALLAEARNAFDVLRGVDDFLTAGKLSSVNSRFVGELTEIVELLTSRGGEADRAERERYEALLEEVLRFQEQVIGYLKDREDGRPVAAPGPAREKGSGPPAMQEEEEGQEEPR